MERVDGIVELNAGSTSCGIAPGMGCSIVHFRTTDGGTALDWMRPYDPRRAGAPPAAASGCFPLVPYSGRIANGVLLWRGTRYRLPTGLLGDAHALHGIGWVERWTADVVAAGRATFSIDYSGPDWPFPFKAVLDFALSERALAVSMRIGNTGTIDMPVGIGLHPTFAGPGISLRADARTVWNIDGEKLFADSARVPPRWDFRAGAPLVGTALEHGFTDWDGRFVLTWRGRRRRLAVAASQALRHLVIYSKAYDEGGTGFVCVEPVSHSVDAFNLSEARIENTGTRVLAPGAELCARTVFTVID